MFTNGIIFISDFTIPIVIYIYICCVHIYYSVIANKNVVSSFGIFEKYNSEDEAKVKLCENPFLNCQKVQQPGQQQQQQGPKVTSQPMVRV